MEKCSNCDRTIGKMETAHLFKDSVVCGECYLRLVGQSTKPSNDSGATGQTCNNCRSSLPSKLVQVHSGLISVSLLLLGLFLVPVRLIPDLQVQDVNFFTIAWCIASFVPLVAYWLLAPKAYVCPDCGAKKATRVS
jgi:hypothetical protein